MIIQIVNDSKHATIVILFPFVGVLYYIDIYTGYTIVWKVQAEAIEAMYETVVKSGFTKSLSATCCELNLEFPVTRSKKRKEAKIAMDIVEMIEAILI